MSKHTLGPWILKDDTAIGHREVCGKDGNYIMAETDHGQETPTNHADWVLISSAPDLLRALKHAVRWHDQLHQSDIELMEKVIAKAEGT